MRASPALGCASCSTTMLSRAAQLNRAVPALVGLCRPHLAAAVARAPPPARRFSVITNVATPEAPQKKGGEGQAASFASSAAAAGIPYAQLTIGARPMSGRGARPARVGSVGAAAAGRRRPIQIARLAAAPLPSPPLLLMRTPPRPQRTQACPARPLRTSGAWR